MALGLRELHGHNQIGNQEASSFKRVVYDAEDGEETWVLFEYEHAIVQADLGGFDIMVGGEKRRRWLGRGLDADGGRFSPRMLALEVVDRVRHDLKLKYESKEA